MSPHPFSNPEAAARRANARARALELERDDQLRNTVDQQELPGHGLVRKVRSACPVCRAPTVRFAASDHSWWIEPPLCPSCDFDQIIGADRPEPFRDKGGQFDLEFARFGTAWPALARALEPLVRDFYERIPYDGLFKLGEITLPKPRPLDKATWRTLLARHVAGDHGEFESSVRFKVAAAHRWAAVFCDVLPRNAVALEQGHGIIRSRFEVPEDQLSGLGDEWFKTRPPQERSGCIARIDIATVLTPGHPPRTHGRLERHDGQCFRHRPTPVQRPD